MTWVQIKGLGLWWHRKALLYALLCVTIKLYPLKYIHEWSSIINWYTIYIESVKFKWHSSILELFQPRQIRNMYEKTGASIWWDRTHCDVACNTYPIRKTNTVILYGPGINSLNDLITHEIKRSNILLTIMKLILKLKLEWNTWSRLLGTAISTLDTINL